ncbi:MAG TPA: hypothetical protein VNL18_03465 [Gemmatimonadales bacterium]|nr:hypothetical protein [Gemmatimonadales bacterium]
MDLVQQVSAIAGVDEAKSRAILGSIFTSVRMAIDAATFSKVNAAFPGMDDWMRGIPLGQGRTGEIIALAGAEGLKRQLKQQGLSDQQMRAVGSAVGAAMQQALPRDASAKVFERVPLLAG